MSNCQYLILYLGSHNVIEWRLMKNAVTDTLVSGATVDVTIKDVEGAALNGESWPLSMAEVEAGKYRATVSHLLEVSAEDNLTAVIDATGPGGEVGHKEIPVVVKISNT